MLDHVQVEDVPVAGGLDGQTEARALKALGIARRDLPPPVRPARDVLELHAEDAGVDVVQPAVEPEAVYGTGGRAVVAQLAHDGVDVVAVRHHRSLVAQPAPHTFDAYMEGDRCPRFAVLEHSDISLYQSNSRPYQELVHRSIFEGEVEAMRAESPR